MPCGRSISRVNEKWITQCKFVSSVRTRRRLTKLQWVVTNSMKRSKSLPPLVACRTRVTKRHKHFVGTPDVGMWFLRSPHVSDLPNALGSEVSTGDTNCLKK